MTSGLGYGDGSRRGPISTNFWDATLDATQSPMRLRWNFDEIIDGTTPNCYAGGAGPQYVGSVHGASVEPGKIDGCLKFDGQTSYVSISDTLTTGDSPSNGITVAAWVKVTRQNFNGLQTIFAAEGGENGSGFHWFSYNSGNCRLYWHYHDSAGQQRQTIAYLSAPGLEADNWYHVAATHDYKGDQNGQVKFYVNGVNVGTSTTFDEIPLTDRPMTIGKRGTSYYFGGFIDDVRVYCYAMCAAEVDSCKYGGTLYYVDAANGAPDSAGTYESPVNTVNAGIGKVSPEQGDSVIVRAGTYEEWVTINNTHSGSPGRLTCLRGYTNYTVNDQLPVIKNTQYTTYSFALFG